MGTVAEGRLRAVTAHDDAKEAVEGVRWLGAGVALVPVVRDILIADAL